MLRAYRNIIMGKTWLWLQGEPPQVTNPRAAGMQQRQTQSHNRCTVAAQVMRFGSPKSHSRAQCLPRVTRLHPHSAVAAEAACTAASALNGDGQVRAGRSRLFQRSWWCRSHCYGMLLPFQGVGACLPLMNQYSFWRSTALGTTTGLVGTPMI